MDQKLPGEIVCNDVADSRPVRRFIQKQVERWLGLHGAAADPSLTYYHVTFNREGAGHLVDCRVEVRLGRQRWVSSQVAYGLHQALLQALDRMSPLPQPARA
jgi:hypothetical protein